ncbi:restriction endonuclease subunit S [Candidatus Obscuribacterales bacterium]|nr:restriction endonuclease subunit S [Candidatus Obscuribacterales bacterium]
MKIGISQGPMKFGDIVKNTNLVDRNMAGQKAGRVVGLEHLDPENLRIRRWSTTENGTSFTRKFVPGQTLFGKRRAYQRKVAYATFSGICSGDILTFETKNPKVLLAELLPFICQSDLFFDYALGTSAGSLSPRTSWSALKDFEVPLLSLQEQKKVVEILWTAEEAYQQALDSLENCIALKRSLLSTLTTRGNRDAQTQQSKLGCIAANWKVMSVEQVTSLCQYGLSMPLHDSGRYPILRMMNYDDGKITAEDLKYVDLDQSDFASYKLSKGEILFNRTNSADLVGKVGIFMLDGDFVFASYLVRLVADQSVMMPEYLNYYLNSELGQRRLLSYATPGVSQSNISAGNLKKVLVPVPPLEEQREIVRILDEVDLNKSLLQQHIRNSKRLLFSLINNLLFVNNTTEAIHV